ncbi:MAG: TolC family protein [bacterium]|nr:TolC family protein [bacterium]
MVLLTAFHAAQAQPPADEPLRLSLTEAVERARSSSPRLRELESLESAALADEQRARAGRWPDVDAGGGYSRLSDVPEFAIAQPDGTLRTIFPNIPNNYSARVGIAVPLYTGGSLRAGIEAAGHQREAVGKDIATANADLVLEVTAAYWDLVLAGERRRVVAEAIASFEAHLEDVRNRQRFGLAAANDVLAVEVERNRAELGRLEAVRAHAVAQANLARLLDLPPATTVAASEPLDAADAPAGELEALVAEALAARPERASLMARIAAAEAAVEVERGARLPQVVASAGYDVARPNSRILPPEDELNDSWGVTVRVAYNLFDGGKRRAAVAGAEARAEAARQRLAELDRALRLQVTAQFLEMETARAAIAVAETAVKSAGENVRVAGDRYREGLIPSSELLDAENALLRAGLDRTTAQARLRLAIAGLQRAMGRGSQEEE